MFDPIASEWHQVRNQPWQIFIEKLNPWINHWIEQFSNHQIKQDYFRIVDIGAGSGRHSLYYKQYSPFLIEIDISREMLKENQQNSIKIQASAENLPIREDKIEIVSSIATLHHLSSHKLRNQAINEMNRILIPKGLVILTVWRFFQPKFINEYKNQFHHFTFNEITQEIGDTNVPWHSISDPNTVYNRFYHLFRASEFTQLIRIFEKWLKISFGKKSKRENFLFIGIKKE